MTYAGTVGDFPKVYPLVTQSFLDEFKRIHAPTIRQNLAQRKRQYFPADERQDKWVQGPIDYRRVLADNVRALMKANNWRRDTIPAFYLAGRKRGVRVSGRTVGYILEGTGPSPALDVVAAIAAAAKPTLMPWQLLVPGFDPRNPPHLVLTEDERACCTRKCTSFAKHS